MSSLDHGTVQRNIVLRSQNELKIRRLEDRMQTLQEESTYYVDHYNKLEESLTERYSLNNKHLQTEWKKQEKSFMETKKFTLKSLKQSEKRKRTITSQYGKNEKELKDIEEKLNNKDKLTPEQITNYETRKKELEEAQKQLVKDLAEVEGLIEGANEHLEELEEDRLSCKEYYEELIQEEKEKEKAEKNALKQELDACKTQYHDKEKHVKLALDSFKAIDTWLKEQEDSAKENRKNDKLLPS